MLIKSIMWNTNNDNEALASLPDEIETPNFLRQEDYKTMDDFFAAVAEWLIYEFGWCHFGFQAIVFTMLCVLPIFLGTFLLLLLCFVLFAQKQN